MVLVSKRRRGLQFLKAIQLFQINHETYCWELAVSTVDLILRGGSTNDTWGAKAYKTFSDHFYHHRVHDKHWQLGEEPSLISLATIDHDSIYTVPNNMPSPIPKPQTAPVTLHRSITMWPRSFGGRVKALRATLRQAWRDPKVSWFTTHHLEPELVNFSSGTI